LSSESDHRRPGPCHALSARLGAPILQLTTLPVEDRTAAETVVRYYPYRWRIERSHDVLKSGCHIEDLPRETFDRWDRALAVDRIVAWRLLWLTDLAGERPEVPWSHRLATRRVGRVGCRPYPPPGSATGAGRSAHRRARDCPMGGFLGRRGDGAPGVKTLWRGYRRLEDLTVMWEILHLPEYPPFRDLRSPRVRERSDRRLPCPPTNQIISGLRSFPCLAVAPVLRPGVILRTQVFPSKTVVGNA
jgi:hypothetical protein